MGDFKERYIFTQEEITYLKKLKNHKNYSHKKWDDLDDKPLNKIKDNIRKFYRSLQENKCYYCKKYLSMRTASDCQIEHILPKSSFINFMFESKNLCLICADCNQYKGAEIDRIIDNEKIIRYPSISNRFKIVHPAYDCYKDYIKVEGKFYHGLDDCRKGKGSNTINVYRLTRQLDTSKYDPEYYTEPTFLQNAARLSGKGNGAAIVDMLASEASTLSNEDKLKLIQRLTSDILKE